MSDIEKRARELLDRALRDIGLHEDAYHVGCGADLDQNDKAAINAIIAALTLRDTDLLAGGSVNLLNQQHPGGIAAQVLKVVPSAALGADEARAIGIGSQGDQSVGIELAEVAPEHEVGVPARSDSGVTASLTPPKGYVPEKPVLAAATQLRRLASAASPLARKAYIKAAETVEMAVSAARQEVSP